MKSQPILNRIKVIFAAMAWGTMGYFLRYIDLPTSVIACARGFIGAISLYLFGILTEKTWKLDWGAIRANGKVLLISGLALGCNWIFLFESYRRTSVAIASLCYYTEPVIVILCSAVLFHEKLTVKKGICVLLALLGMLLISGVLEGNLGNGYGVDGMICALTAAFLYSAVTILGRFTKDLSSNQETIVKLFIASLILIPYVLLTVDFTELHPTGRMILMLIILGVVSTGAAFAAYFSAIHHLESQEVALYTYLDPVVSVLVSVFLLGEEMNPSGLVGAVLLIGALVLFELGQKPSEK